VISNAVMVLNGKGGVLKTSVTANLAGLAAASKWRTLAVDLDPQGNLARDLGYMDSSDGGSNLFATAFARGRLEPLRDVRPGLDVVAGGPDTRRFADQVCADLYRTGAGSGALTRLDTVLGPMAGEYDLIVLDLPPGDAVIHAVAALAAHYILVPTAGDRSSNDGLGEVFGQLLEARALDNPDLEVLGVVVTLVPTGGRAIVRDIRQELDAILEGKVRVFDTTIRFAKAAALGYRDRGLLANEYEVEASKALPWYKARSLAHPVERYSSASSGLAEDYQQLAEEILGAFSERQAAYLAKAG
jgi:chromosome partitioning protein